jgi:ribosomal protein S18 acetylase RimI-like enzyme
MSLTTMRRFQAADREAALAVQRGAFGGNVAIMGVEPLPLRADYDEIFATHEAWLLDRDGALVGMLILLPREDDLYVWSIAAAPRVQRSGVGNTMLAAAEERARQLRQPRMRLRTSEKLVNNVKWYQRHGFAIESVEQTEDRRVVHMVKQLT